MKTLLLAAFFGNYVPRASIILCLIRPHTTRKANAKYHAKFLRLRSAEILYIL